MESAETFISELKGKERRWRKRSLAITITIVVLILTLVFFAKHQVESLQQESARLEHYIDQLNDSIVNNRKYLQQREFWVSKARGVLESEIDKHSLTREKLDLVFKNLLLQDSATKQFIDVMSKIDSHKIKISLLENAVLDRPEAKKIFIALLQLQQVKWSAHGASPEEGFDDLGLISYVLRAVKADTSFEFMDRSQLKSGDIVVLDCGYSMFYFSVSNKPFYVGLTPYGLCPLDTGFAKPLKYQKVIFKN